MLIAPRAGSEADVDSYVGRLLDSAPAVAPAPVPVAAAAAPAPAPMPAAAPAPLAAPAAIPAVAAASVRAADSDKDDVERRRRASDRMERWIGFVVAGQGFGVEVLRVLEVQRLSEITPVPGATPELMGAINLRGQIVPVLDLGQRLGFGPANLTGASRIIIVDYSGQPAGLCVDGVSEVISASASSVERTPPLGGRIAEGWIRGVLRHKGEMVLLLEPVRLLADVELQADAPGR